MLCYFQDFEKLCLFFFRIAIASLDLFLICSYFWPNFSLNVLTKLFKELLSSGDANKLQERHRMLIRHLVSAIDATKSDVEERLKKVSVDRISMALLPKNSIDDVGPDEIPTALSSKGNGDCLYNSASILICGNELLACLLRALVSIELVIHRSYYSNHPYIEEKQSVLPDKNVFEACMKSLSTKDTTKEEAVVKEAITNCNALTWSSMMCLLALSSVIQSRIKSIYPNTSNYYAVMFNGFVYPRVTASEPDKHIMWTKSTSLETVGGSFKSNHFVPIVAIHRSEQTKRKLKKKHTPVSKKKKASITTATPPLHELFPPMETKPSTQSTIKNCFFRTKLSDLSPTQSASNTSDPIRLQSTSKSEHSQSLSDQFDSIIPDMSEELSPLQSNPTQSVPGSSSSTSQASSSQSNPESLDPGPSSSSPSNPQQPHSSQSNLDERTSQSFHEAQTRSSQTNDIYSVFETVSSFTDSERLEFIKNCRPPVDDFVFPCSGSRNSRCQASWLKENDWLLYSKSADSLYCLSCVMFPSRGGQEPKLCSKSGMRAWPSAKSKIASHKTAPNHETSHAKLLAFKVNRKDPTKAVHMMGNKAEVERMKKNRVRLKTIIKCVVFLGKQGLAFRGHREDKDHSEDPNTNPGNFKALLQLLESTGNPDITYLLRNAPRNAKYTSKTIYEQIIDVLGESVTEKLIDDVKKAKFFSILADETQDVSNQEQMALVIRFVDEKTDKVREEFIKFVRCDKGLSGEALSKLILDTIDSLGLSMTKCRGQGYDGAGSMVGCKKGTAARISNLYPKVIFIHCFSHRLNLSVMKIINVQVVRDMFDNVRIISDFFNNSTKRYERFLEVIEKCMPADDALTKLINICRTRWVQRIEGLSRFKDAYKATFTALKTIGTNEQFHGTEWNAESRATATSLGLLMQKFEFIVALVVSHELIQYVHSLTVSLQSSTLAIVEAYQSVATVIETLEGLKVNIDDHHQRWYDEAVRLAATIDVKPSTKRTCFFQRNRDNTPADNTCEYYRRSITIPVLNEMIEDLRRRFTPENLVFIGGFYCIPQLMNKCAGEWKAKVLTFMKAYRDDMPNYDSCQAELDCWTTFWMTHFEGDLPDTLDKTLQYTKSSMYPNIHTVLLLLGTIPVTTCTCERCMSVLRRLKTYLRSSMEQDRFNDLSVLQIHYGIDIDEDDVLDQLVAKYPKRIKMANILIDNID